MNNKPSRAIYPQTKLVHPVHAGQPIINLRQIDSMTGTYRLNYVAEFAGEAGSVQGIKYFLTACASHLHTKDLENNLLS